MKKVYASIWYNPNGKWKLNEAIVVENGKITGNGVGGSFYFGKYKIKQDILKEALLDLIFFNPEINGNKWRGKFRKIKRESEVEFVSDKKLAALKKKYPEDINV